MAQISGEHWTLENVKKHFAEKRNDLYARSRLAKTQEEKQKVMRDMQRFNMEARKYPGVIPPIAASSLRETTSQRLEKPFMGFGRMMEASPRSKIWRRDVHLLLNGAVQKKYYLLPLEMFIVKPEPFSVGEKTIENFLAPSIQPRTVSSGSALGLSGHFSS